MTLHSEYRTRAIVGFNPDQWSDWFKDNPKLEKLERRPKGKRLIPDSQKFLDTGGDVYFLLKSDSYKEVNKVFEKAEEKMKDFCLKFDVTKSQPPSKVIAKTSCVTKFYLTKSCL